MSTPHENVVCSILEASQKLFIHSFIIIMMVVHNGTAFREPHSEKGKEHNSNASNSWTCGITMMVVPSPTNQCALQH